MTNPPPGWYDNEPPEPQWYGATQGYNQAPTPGSRSRSLRTAALILVPLLVLTGAVGLFLFNRQSGGDQAGPVNGQLRGTYPTKPVAGWQLSADAVFSGAKFVLPDSMAYTYQTPGVIDLGDVLVTAAINPGTDREATLVGIDAESGKVLWQNSDVGFHPTCADEIVDGAVPCLGTEAVFGPGAADQEPRVSFVDVRSGKVLRQLTAPPKVSTVMVHGADVYTVGYQAMAKGNAEDLTASWQREYGTEAGCPGSGDSHYFGVNDEVVYYGSDAGVVVAAAETGDQLTDHALQGVNLFGGKGIAGRVCDADMRATVEVVGLDGQVRHTVSADDWIAKPWLVSDAAQVPVIIGDTAYDFDSGGQLWTGQGGPQRITHIVGDTAVGHEKLLDDFDNPLAGSLVGVDLSSGDRLWEAPVSGNPVMSDGERVMVGDGDQLSAVNLGTGAVDWQMPSDRHAISPAGNGFTITDGDSITFYPPTGGASFAPGRHAAAASAPEQREQGGPITKCGKTPELRPVQYRAENGAMVVKMEFKASCPGGDIISSNRFRVTIRDGASLIASGHFDFSNNPVVLDGENTTNVDLTFGPGTIWRLPNTLGTNSGAGGDTPATTADASGNELVDCADEGTSTGPDNIDPGAANSGNRGPTGTTPDGAPCVDTDALDALRVQTDTDRQFVQAGLADRWVAQLSAKHPGLVAPDVDGRVLTWTPCEILRQHVRLRLQYPEVRMVWSDEWRTFDLQGWWVTIAGLTFPDADAANRWCDDRAIPVDECFAKVVSNTRDSTGTTKYRR